MKSKANATCYILGSITEEQSYGWTEGQTYGRMYSKGDDVATTIQATTFTRTTLRRTSEDGQFSAVSNRTTDSTTDTRTAIQVSYSRKQFLVDLPQRRSTPATDGLDVQQRISSAS